MVVVEGEPHLERSVGKSLLALQQSEDLGEDLVKRHGHPSVGQERIYRVGVRRP